VSWLRAGRAPKSDSVGHKICFTQDSSSLIAPTRAPTVLYSPPDDVVVGDVELPCFCSTCSTVHVLHYVCVESFKKRSMRSKNKNLLSYPCTKIRRKRFHLFFGGCCLAVMEKAISRKCVQEKKEIQNGDCLSSSSAQLFYTIITITPQQ